MHPPNSRFEFQDYRYRSLANNHLSHFTHLDSKSSAHLYSKPQFCAWDLFSNFYLFNFLRRRWRHGGQRRMTDDPATPSGDCTLDFFCSMCDQSLEKFFALLLLLLFMDENTSGKKKKKTSYIFYSYRIKKEENDVQMVLEKTVMEWGLLLFLIFSFWNIFLKPGSLSSTSEAIYYNQTFLFN